MNPHEKLLRQCAEEIAKAGHNGWGNTCSQAADEVATLTARVAAAVLPMAALANLPLQYTRDRAQGADELATTCPACGILDLWHHVPDDPALHKPDCARLAAEKWLLEQPLADAAPEKQG